MVAKNDFNIDRSGVPHEKQKEIFNRLVKERALEFSAIKDKIDPNNLIDTFKTDGNKPKVFGNYQTPLKFFEDLRGGNINPKEVLKNQARFKLPNQKKNTINNIMILLYYIILIILFFFAI